MQDKLDQGHHDWQRILTVCHDLCQQVGQQLLSDFGQVQAEAKSDGSLVTRADRWADQTLREAIATTFPGHGLLTEETPQPFPEQDWCWIIDPLDGTTNFAMGIPIWGISLGLAYRGTPVFGYIAMPTLGTDFYGFWPGSSGLLGPTGAYQIPSGTNRSQPSQDPSPGDSFTGSSLSSVPLQASRAPLTSSHLFSFCTRSIALLQTPTLQLTPFPCKIRMLGASTYNLLGVANGAILGGIEATPRIWDIAAVWVIVQAAGGVWHFLDENPFPLQPGRDYHRPAYRSGVLARPDLEPHFHAVFAP